MHASRLIPVLVTITALTLSSVAFGAPKPPAGGSSAPAQPPAAANQPTHQPDADGDNAHVLDGRLQQGDRTLRSGEFVDEYRFQVRAGQGILALATSSEIDPYLIVRNTDGTQQDNDDIEDGNLNAGVVMTAAGDGLVTVMVTSAAAGESGAYRFAFTSATTSDGDNAAPAPRAKPPAGGAAPAQRGTTFRGDLSQGDQTLRSGEFVDAHSFRVRRGQRVTVRMESGEFDAYLIVLNTDGSQEDNDDIAQGNLNAEVTLTAAGDGELGIRATSASPGETGAYVIRVSAP